MKAGTVGELKAQGYRPRSVKQEMRDNLIARLRRAEPLFAGIVGYDESVVPQIENAVLSGQDIVFLGERGQAKTRMARLLVGLLDDAVPALAGCEINDDPFAPICGACGRASTARRPCPRRVDPPRPPLRREARHPRHHDRGPDRRGRPDQGRRGRYLGDELTSTTASCRGPTAASSRSTSCPTWPSGSRWASSTSWRSVTSRSAATRSPAARRLRGRQRQPGGLHQPRPHHHAPQGPLGFADPHPLPRRLDDEITIMEAERTGFPADGSRPAPPTT